MERLYRFTLAGECGFCGLGFERLYRTPLAGECPLFGALTFKEPSRFEDGAPSRVRYAL